MKQSTTYSLGFDPTRPHVYISRCVRCGDETQVWVAFMLWTDACRRHYCAKCLRRKAVSGARK